MTDDLKEHIRKIQSEYEAAISALDGAVRTMKSFIPENVFAKASIEECERSSESLSRPSPKLSDGPEGESGNGISSAFKQWFEQEWASYRDISFTDKIAAKAWALKAWRFISANAAPSPSASSVPVATPVMWFVSSDPDADGWVVFKEREAEDCKQDGCDVTPLYAAPQANPAPSVLTDEQIIERCKEAGIKWIEPQEPFSFGGEMVAGFPGSFDMAEIGSMRALLQANGARK